MTSKSFQITAFCALGCFGFYAGIWQTKRKAWKNQIIDRKARRLHGQPTQCPNSPITASRSDKLEFLPVVVEGQLKLDEQVIVGPRAIPWKSPQDRLEPSWGGFLHCPLITASGSKIIVNRGWSPHKEVDDALEPDMKPDGTIKLVGVMRQPETNPWFMPAVDPQVHTDAWLVMDRNAADKHWKLGLNEREVPVIVDIIAPEILDGWPRRKILSSFTEVAVQPLQHDVYTMIWFMLGVIAFFYAAARALAPTGGRVGKKAIRKAQLELPEPIRSKHPTLGHKIMQAKPRS